MRGSRRIAIAIPQSIANPVAAGVIAAVHPAQPDALSQSKRLVHADAGRERVDRDALTPA